MLKLYTYKAIATLNLLYPDLSLISRANGKAMSKKEKLFPILKAYTHIFSVTAVSQHFVIQKKICMYIFLNGNFISFLTVSDEGEEKKTVEYF